MSCQLWYCETQWFQYLAISAVKAIIGAIYKILNWSFLVLPPSECACTAYIMQSMPTLICPAPVNLWNGVLFFLVLGEDPLSIAGTVTSSYFLSSFLVNPAGNAILVPCKDLRCVWLLPENQKCVDTLWQVHCWPSPPPAP